MDFAQVYKGRRVLLTGDTGFKGSWLGLWLHSLGAEVVGYALPPEHATGHYNAVGLGELIHHQDGDLRDHQALRRLVDQFQPEFIFHLAAQALVKLSYREPKLTFDTNLGGSVNLLEAARSCPALHSLVYVTSDKCYENREWLWGYRENDELGGHDPYSASKAAAEIVFSAYQDSFLQHSPGLGAASARAGNVIGGGDQAENRIVPDCINALERGEPILLRNPASVRPWQHVLEPLSGYLLLAARLYQDPAKFRGAWNFGPDTSEDFTVERLAQEVIANWGQGETKVAQGGDGQVETMALHLSCEKANHRLGWRPRWPFARAVKETVVWYQALARGESCRRVSLEQIARYMEWSDD